MQNIEQNNFINDKNTIVNSFRKMRLRRSRAMLVLTPAPVFLVILAFIPQLKNNMVLMIMPVFLLIVTSIAFFHLASDSEENTRFENLANLLNNYPEDSTLSPFTTVMEANENAIFNVVLDKDKSFTFGKYLVCNDIFQLGTHEATLPTATPIVKFVESDVTKIETNKFSFDEQNDLMVYTIYWPKSRLNVIYANE